MYKKILVALENGRADEALLPHIASWRGCCGSELLLIHVADGWAARNFDQLKLAESEEMIGDRHYLESTAGVIARRRACGSTSTWRAATRRTRSSRPPSTNSAT